MAVVGERVLLVGSFTHVGGQSRNHLAAVDATTGVVDSWDPNADDVVTELVVAGDTVFVGGSFTNIGGQSRTWLAAIDTATGAVRPWNADLTPVTDLYPNVDDIWALAVGGETVYFSGRFVAVGGQPRSFLAAVDATSGSPRSWNFNPDPSEIFPDSSPGGLNYAHVLAIAVDGGHVYLGGNREFLENSPGSPFGPIMVGSLIDGAVLRGSTRSPPRRTPPGIPSPISSTPRLVASRRSPSPGRRSTWRDVLEHRGAGRFVLAGIDATTGLATDFAPSLTNRNAFQRSAVTTLAVMGSAVFAAGGFTEGLRSDGTIVRLSPDGPLGFAVEHGFAIFGLDISTTCVVTALREGPPPQQDVTVGDANGLDSIININITNGTVSVPEFTPGTTSPVVVTATKADPAMGTFWEFDTVDSLGNVHHCV